MDQQQKIDPEAFRAEREPKYRKIVQWMWRLIFAGIAGAILAFVILSFSDLPSVEELENPKSELATEVYFDNGETIGRFFVENRVPVTYDELSPYLVQALVATEDERYYRHTGIDFRALGRTAFKTVLMGDRSSGGASTITQQLAKLLFTEKPGSGIERIIQKLKEWIIAIRLERKYTKQEIMAMYLNKFNFINDAYGIKAASEIYFGKSQDSLNIQEAATLVGMLQNPSLYNPVRFEEKTIRRRSVVFQQMMRNDLLTQVEYDSLKNLPLDKSNFHRATHFEGPAPYFRMEMRKDILELLERPEYRKPDGSKYNIFTDGLKIYTTINPVLQRYAEEAALENMKEVQAKFWKEWGKQDPWEYRNSETTDREMELRQLTLRRLVRESDRYAGMRTAYLEEILTKISENISDADLRDADIERMMEEDEAAGSLTKLVSSKIISTNLELRYRKVMKSEYWPELRKQWRSLQTQVESAFKKPVKMRVFAYTDKLEKDTVMSPLDSIKYHRMFLQIGAMAVEPTSGHVKAWVGGINHKYFQYDHVRTNRQVGSTFKPFIYATAIAQQGISPCFQVLDVAQTILPGEGNFHLIKEWTPKNSEGGYSGRKYTLLEGLQYSKNTVSVFLMKQLGDTDPVRGMVHNMGIDSTKKYANGRYRVPKQPSICLGATDLTVYEMTGAYTTFANNGIYNRPTFIDRIEDKNGRIIYQSIPEEHPAMEQNANYVMVEMLRFTGRRLSGVGALKSDVGGKTGTTNDHVDGWYMGISPYLVIGTWVGGTERWIRFRSMANGQGAAMAKPFYVKMMNRIEADPNIGYDVKQRFFRPPGDLGIEIDCSQYTRDNGPGEEFELNNTGEFFDDIFGDENENIEQEQQEQEQQ